MNMLIDYYWRSLKLLVKPYLKLVFVNKVIAVTVSACFMVNILGSTGYATIMAWTRLAPGRSWRL